MELHRLDGFDATGLDASDISDSQSMSEIIHGVSDSAPDIAYEILDEEGNVILYADAEENIYVIDGLQGFFKKIGRGLKKFAKKVGKKVIRPVVRTFNRFLNPATILLRNGFLLAMKINMFKVASRLRFGYLSEAQARKMGIDMRKFSKLKKTVRKAEKIYRTAGGRGRNLRKAILKGKGNKDRKVPLSGFTIGSIDTEPDMYNDPFEKFVVEADIDTIEAFMNNEFEVDGLGAVATGTATAAASGAVAGIAGILSKIGNIFGAANKVKQSAQTLFQKPARPVRQLPAPISRSIPRTSSFRPSPFSRGRATPSVISRNRSVTNTPPVEKKGFLQKHKTTLLVLGGLAVVGTGIAIAVNSNKKKTAKPISGTPKKRMGQGKRNLTQRDALGRFTKGSSPRRKKKTATKRKTPEKLIPKALL
ncbi:hypothetical protein [Aquimarina algiphila]|uniref:Uncharacterized protein n=1 Tax=Aquimarina algiphila TaxID=2047982 RepID=A0A554VAG5_9FLAO|nr:hypothetical protein [Aquimarina algiphila]TSE03072.1 hypothetical protein FOF46_30060 [Aquimarina algiphila]